MFTVCRARARAAGARGQREAVAAQPFEDHWRVCPATAEERILSELFS